MPWFRLDDAWHSHPKVVAAGNAAAGLWARCGSYSAAYLLDGFVPDVVVGDYGTRIQVDRLSAVGLWIPVENGYKIPDYLDFNPTAERVRKEREAARERQRRGRERQGMSRRDTDGSHAVSHSVSHGPVTVVPTQPDPTPSLKTVDYSNLLPTGEAGDNSERRERIAAIYGQHAARKAGRNANGYATTATANALERDSGRLDELIARYPTAPDDVLAAALNGETHSLRYYLEPEPETPFLTVHDGGETA